MNYYGKGAMKSMEKGRELLKESFDNGVFYGDTPERTSLPDKLEIMSYSSGACLVRSFESRA